MTEVLALRTAADRPLPFAADPETLFADAKGVHSPKVEKRQRKLAEKLPFLGRFLQPNERVQLITTASSPFTILEQLTTGWIIFYLKRAMLVVTTDRILHVLTDGSFRYRDSIAEIRFDDVTSMKQSFGSLKIKYRNGSSERFLTIPWSERRKFRALLAKRTFAGPGGSSADRTHLCPRCTKPLRANVYQCGACQLEFKSASDAMRIALLIPGGGYFYTGHWILGIGDALAEVVLIALLIVSLMELNAGAAGASGASILFGVLLVIEKAISMYHTHHFIKEYLPKEKPTPL